jgi:hypothetical protein
LKNSAVASVGVPISEKPPYSLKAEANLEALKAAKPEVDK